MSAAAAMAVTIIGARLTITLILDPVHRTAVLTTVSWHLIGWLSPENVIPLMIVIINELTVVDGGCHGTRAEAVLDKSVTHFSATFGHLTTALAGTVCIRLAHHTLATVSSSIGTARFLVSFVWCGVGWHLGPSLLDGLLRSEAS